MQAAQYAAIQSDTCSAHQDATYMRKCILQNASGHLPLYWEVSVEVFRSR